MTVEELLERLKDIAEIERHPKLVVATMTKDLTEQWKKGVLERGKKYWCKLTDGTSEICYLWLQTNHFTFLTGYQSRCLPDEDIAEVLAPVPSYEKYKCLETGIILANAVIKNTEEENAKLKELLKDLIDEADGSLQAIQKDCESDDWSVFNYPEVQYFYNLKDKIDEVLNDKECG